MPSGGQRRFRPSGGQRRLVIRIADALGPTGFQLLLIVNQLLLIGRDALAWIGRRCNFQLLGSDLQLRAAATGLASSETPASGTTTTSPALYRLGCTPRNNPHMPRLDPAYLQDEFVLEGLHGLAGHKL
jgi:hypothetical protein